MEETEPGTRCQLAYNEHVGDANIFTGGCGSDHVGAGSPLQSTDTEYGCGSKILFNATAATESAGRLSTAGAVSSIHTVPTVVTVVIADLLYSGIQIHINFYTAYLFF